MKVILEIEGNLRSGYVARVVEREADDETDERRCDLLLAAIRRTILSENMDVPTGGTE